MTQHGDCHRLCFFSAHLADIVLRARSGASGGGDNRRFPGVFAGSGNFFVLSLTAYLAHLGLYALLAAGGRQCGRS